MTTDLLIIWLSYLVLFRHPLKLWLVPCSKSDTEQKWYFTNYDEDGIPPVYGDEDELYPDHEEAHEEL